MGETLHFTIRCFSQNIGAPSEPASKQANEEKSKQLGGRTIYWKRRMGHSTQTAWGVTRRFPGQARPTERDTMVLSPFAGNQTGARCCCYCRRPCHFAWVSDCNFFFFFPFWTCLFWLTWLEYFCYALCSACVIAFSGNKGEERILATTANCY